jgi:secreted trypsin-like serine protease
MAFLKVLSAALLLGLATLQPCQGQSRIIGGAPVLSARYPYFAELRIVYEEKGQQFVTYCGGSLITSDLVLVRTGSMECKMHCRIVP